MIRVLVHDYVAVPIWWAGQAFTAVGGYLRAVSEPPRPNPRPLIPRD